MAKLFVQSQCPTCGAATLMTDFRSINDLGTIESLTTPVEHHSDVVVNLDEIKTRLQQSLNYDQATSYKKQKHSLLEGTWVFPGASPCFVTLATVTHRNLCRFLIFKDKSMPKHKRTSIVVNF